MAAADTHGRTPGEQREWERAAGRAAAAFAFLSAAFVIAASAYGIASLPRVEGEARGLVTLAEHKSEVLTTGVLAILSIICLAAPLLYLYRVTRYRRPQIFAAAAVLAVAGPLLSALGEGLIQLHHVDAAEKFVASGPRTDARAEDLVVEGRSPYIAFRDGGKLALGFALVVIGLNAMRAGVLSRFMGVLGIILGALYVLPIGPTPLIQVFWLCSLGLLFLNRWPGGRGPAWEAMAEVPWPTAAQIAEHRRAADEEHAGGTVDPGGGRADSGASAPADGPAAGNGAASVSRTSQRSRKRRKKRR